MSMGLKSGDKTNINTLMSDLNTVIAGLDPSDRAQLGLREVLNTFRTQLLELMRIDRAQ